MKRHKSLIPLSQDHHNGLMLAQLIKKDAPEYKGLPTDLEGKVNYIKKSWENELKLHFQNEERILFPSVFGKHSDIDSLITVLKNEHVTIANSIDDLKLGGNLESKINDLGVLLERHIRKEERVLFQKLQSLCTEELEELQGKIFPANKNCTI